MASESRGLCSHPLNEACREHPVDCTNCLAEASCTMKKEAQAHPDKIKRCRWFRRRPKDP